MPPHSTLRIKIPIEKEDVPEEKPARFSYIPVYLHNIVVGNVFYTLIDNIYMAHKVEREPYSFTTSGGKTTFMFGCAEEPIQMICLLIAGSNYVKVYDDIHCVFTALYKRAYY